MSRKTKTKPIKTYFIRFDGAMLFMGDSRPFTIEKVFDTGNKQEIFDELFDDEEGWDKLQDMFYEMFQDCEMYLECPPPEYDPEKPDETYDDFAAFVRYYVTRGYTQFFKDVDKTWVTNEPIAYAFVKSNEVDKIMTILMHCGGEEALEHPNTEDFDPENYYERPKRPSPSKRKKKKRKLLA